MLSTSLSVGVSFVSIQKTTLAQVSLVSSFNPSLGDLCDIAFDPLSGNPYIYGCFDDEILEYQPDGTFVKGIPNPPPASGNIGLDFTPESINLNGTLLPTNTLLFLNNDDSPTSLTGIDKTNGNILASLDFASLFTVGGSYSANRDTLFAVDWLADVIREIDTSNGSELNSFSTSGFDVFFGDLDVNQASGNLFVVSDRQNTIRELTPTGAFVQDIDVGALGVSGMSGIAFDDANGQAWISSTNGTVYLLDGFDQLIPPDPDPEPSSVPEFSSIFSILLFCVTLGFYRKLT